MSKSLRIIPLGGLGEIGKNMTVIEYDDQILVIDAGLMFPENDMLGIDLIIPDYQYLLDKRDKVKAVLITHAHEDHVGALEHLMKEIDAPIYATPLTMGLIEIKLKEANLLGKVTMKTIQAGDAFAIGSFLVEPFHVAHSIPDCVGFGITTPVGLVVHTGDYKFDHTPVDGWPPDFAKLAEFSARGVLCLLADSTNAEKPGWTASEAVITSAFDDVFKQAQGRVIVASFASLISRIQQVANAAAKYGRKLAVTGRSMRENTKMARKLGYLDIPDGMVIDIDQVNKYPPHQVTIMATGSQGEPTSVMGRLAHGRHRNVTIQPGDTVVLSAHTIPGNEEFVSRVINRLMKQGAEVLYEHVAQVHVSGHASREEMKLMINLVRPRFFVPIHGEIRHLVQHGKIAEEMGIPKQNIAVVENGTVLELTEDKMTVKERLPGGYVFVAGQSVGEVDIPVMRDREKLAENGFFLVAVGLDDQGKVRRQPRIITRGFANLEKEQAEGLLEGAEEVVTRTIGIYKPGAADLEARVEEALSRYLYTETGRRPLIYVVLQ
ncbi:MAG: ribonuclease J [Chloroflexi bacterium]|nr:ribonuclease J [Chloroflexota bacterium]MBP8057888.1 ribonuclease J [Chloroflexota bacterium]